MTNEIVLFKEITTEQVLVEYEQKAETYVDLYVDMKDPEQRRFVKTQESEINDIVKALDKGRIKKTKDAKAEIDKEFNFIVARLKKANEPFSALHDAYKVERKKELDAEKEVQRLKDELYQKGVDHEEAISENELYDLRKEKQARELKEMQEKMIEEAKKQADIDLELAEEKRLRDVEQAKIDEQNRILAEQQAIADAKAQREANEAHVLSCMTEAKEALMSNTGIDEETARKVIIAIKNGTARLSINF